MIVAVLEDNPEEANLLHHILVSAGHDCTIYSTGQALIDALQIQHFELLILDWSLPDMTGYDVVNWVRNKLSTQLLVLFLSNRALEENVVLALMAGGDDYMVKPASRAELLARVHALSRRVSRPSVGASTTTENEILQVGAYRLNRIMKSAEVHGKPVELKPKEFDIAFMLMQNIGAIVSREKLMETVWGRDLLTTSRTLDTHMSNVRSKLGLKPENKVKLSTIYTHGYRLDLLD